MRPDRGRQVAIFRVVDGTLHAVSNYDPFQRRQRPVPGIVGDRAGDPRSPRPFTSRRSTCGRASVRVRLGRLEVYPVRRAAGWWRCRRSGRGPPRRSSMTRPSTDWATPGPRDDAFGSRRSTVGITADRRWRSQADLLEIRGGGHPRLTIRTVDLSRTRRCDRRRWTSFTVRPLLVAARHGDGHVAGSGRDLGPGRGRCGRCCVTPDRGPGRQGAFGAAPLASKSPGRHLRRRWRCFGFLTEQGLESARLALQLFDPGGHPSTCGAGRVAASSSSPVYRWPSPRHGPAVRLVDEMCPREHRRGHVHPAIPPCTTVPHRRRRRRGDELRPPAMARCWRSASGRPALAAAREAGIPGALARPSEAERHGPPGGLRTRRPRDRRLSVPFAFPLALEVTGRRCVLTGGGPPPWPKVAALLDAGATVVVIAATAEPGWWASPPGRARADRAGLPPRRSGWPRLVFATGTVTRTAPSSPRPMRPACSATPQDTPTATSPAPPSPGGVICCGRLHRRAARRCRLGPRSPGRRPARRTSSAADRPGSGDPRRGHSSRRHRRARRLWRTALDFDVLGLLGAGQWEQPGACCAVCSPADGRRSDRPPSTSPSPPAGWGGLDRRGRPGGSRPHHGPGQDGARRRRRRGPRPLVHPDLVAGAWPSTSARKPGAIPSPRRHHALLVALARQGMGCAAEGRRSVPLRSWLGGGRGAGRGRDRVRGGPGAEFGVGRVGLSGIPATDPAAVPRSPS